MRPTDNAVWTAKIIWRDARRKETWRDCHLQFGALALYLMDENEADYEYFRDLRDEALDMMEDV